MDKKIILAFIGILLIGFALRALPLKYVIGSHVPIFEEPDNYVYYSLVMQTYAVHGFNSIINNLSGFPTHSNYTERAGMIEMPLAFSYAFNIPPYYVMLALPILFAVGEMIMTYLLAMELTKNRWISLLAMLLFAIMPATIFKNQITEYRGESFVPLYVAVAIYAMIKIWQIAPIKWQKQPCKVVSAFIMWGGLFIISFSVALWQWDGGVYILPIILIFLSNVILSQLATSRKQRTMLILGMILASLVAVLYGANLFSGWNASAIAEAQPLSLGSAFLQFSLAIGLAFIGFAFCFWRYVITGKNGEAFQGLTALFFVTIFLAVAEIRWVALAGMAVAIFASYAMLELWNASNNKRERETFYWLLAMLLISSLTVTALQVPYYKPINQENSLQSAMLSISQNMPANATFLTLWDDGGYIEGMANRTSYSDSIMAQNYGFVQFPRWLFSPAGSNDTYIEAIHPDYVFAQEYWWNFTNALLLEGGLSENASLNGTYFSALVNDQPSLLDSNGLAFVPVYAYNGSTIYKVVYRETNTTTTTISTIVPNTTTTTAKVYPMPNMGGGGIG